MVPSWAAIPHSAAALRWLSLALWRLESNA